MKKLMTILVVAALGGLATVARFGATPTAAVAEGSCGGGRSPALSNAAALRHGSSIAAADGGAIEMIGNGRNVRVSPPEHGRGVLRHVMSRSGVGIAYVRDRAGGDVVVADTAAGLRRFPTRAEARQPSLSAAGALVWAQRDGLRLVAPGSAAVRTLPGPVHGGVTFSPLFDGGAIVAGVAAAPSRAVPDDEFRSNLWRYGSGRWNQMTRFAGGADRWSIVRMPFLAPDGSVEFVRVHGRASVDRMPTFELWRLRGSTANKLRTLPGEMYLAGFEGSDRLWNIRDGSTGAWRIEQEQADGSLRFAGCGAVAVDPLDRTDPDTRPGTRWAPLSPKSDGSSVEQPQVGETSGSPVDQILVGDFASVDDANAAAGRIRAAFGSATVVTASDVPTVLRPGVWAVLVPLTSDDAEGELTRFRDVFPDLAGWSWIVSV